VSYNQPPAVDAPTVEDDFHLSQAQEVAPYQANLQDMLGLLEVIAFASRGFVTSSWKRSFVAMSEIERLVAGTNKIA